MANERVEKMQIDMKKSLRSVLKQHIGKPLRSVPDDLEGEIKLCVADVLNNHLPGKPTVQVMFIDTEKGKVWLRFSSDHEVDLSPDES